MSYKIYIHMLPNTETVFYVGKAFKNSRPNQTRGRNNRWHEMVEKFGGFTAQIISEFETDEEASLCEEETIDKYFKLGHPLVNKSRYSAVISHHPHTEEHKAKLKGNELWKLVKNNGFRGKTHTEEQKAKWSLERRGVSRGKGIKKSEEHRKKLSISKTGIPNKVQRKLNNMQVEEIKKLLITGQSYIAELARKYGVGESTIRRIRDGDSYREVKINA